MLDLTLHDTIAAIASAPGSAPRGIVRISGPRVAECLNQVLPGPGIGTGGASRQRPCRFAADFRLATGHTVPAEVLYWPTAVSYTRQPTAEVHTIGSPPLLELILQSLFQTGARAARPGEFTLRAFLSGRIDLTQAEAVIAAIDAQNESQFQFALEQLAGGLAHPLSQIRAHLVDLVADIEAGLDFVDEDIAFVQPCTVAATIIEAIDQLQKIREQLESRGDSRVLPQVVLIGRPNAGKSSLLNRLAGRTLAIVSSEPGTTRDYLQGTVQHRDIALEIIDTAGVGSVLDAALSRRESTTDEIDRSMTRQTARARRCADIAVCCVEPSDPPEPAEVAAWFADSAVPIVVAFTKADLLFPETILQGVGKAYVDSLRRLLKNAVPLHGPIAVSAKTGIGCPELLDCVLEILTKRQAESPSASILGIRCAEGIEQALRSLQSALDSVTNQAGDEMVAADIRLALHALGELTGAVHNEEILDRLFSRFCIGK